MKTAKATAPLFLPLALAACATPAGGDLDAIVERYVAQSWLPGDNQPLERLRQDETQIDCTRYRNNPPPAVAKAIEAREAAKIRYPADGRLMGDWKVGEKIAQAGNALRVGRIEPDSPKRDPGGNCYACHQIDKREVAAGNLGPSLTAYGKLRGTGEAVVRYTYNKIYNAQATLACSNMTRFGVHGILTPVKVAHITAYLLDPASPVNR
jgi:sulfur-oxidizing protein SoxX